MIRFDPSWSRLALGLLLILGSHADAQVPPFELPRGAATNAFSMTVKVVDAVSGKPLENSTIWVPQLMPQPGVSTSNDWRFVTDLTGVTTVRAPALAVALNSFSLTLSNGSHPIRQVSWSAQSGSIRGALPAEYTFQLARGVSIGGYVRDERGQPLAGLKVVPWGNGAGAYRYNQTDATAREYSSLNRDDNLGVASDAKGFWIYTNFPADTTSFTLDVLRGDGSRNVFISSGTTRQFSTEVGDEVDLDSLRATNAVLAIKEGISLRGLVLDESGRPIAGARVKERSGAGWNTPIQLTTNDAQGRFTFPHRTGTQYLMTAEADGYAISSQIVTVRPEMEEVKLVLPPARPLRLRILGENDVPVVGAEARLPDYRNRGHLMTWKGTSDASGRVVWTNAPRQGLTVAVNATNYATRLARAEPGGEEQVVRLAREIAQTNAVRVRVLDAETQQPIPRFAVWRDLEPNTGFKESTWVGTNGELKTELRRQEFREERGGAYRLQVRVEGFLPWSSEMIYFDEGDFETTVRLNKAAPPVGVVVLPDGQPAGDAKLMLVAGQGSVFMNSPENQYPGTGVITVKSGADGSFKFDGAEDEQRIVMIHRGGFASVAVEEVRRTGKIALQRWARLDGILRVGGKPLAKERISIKSPVSWEGGASHQLVFSTSTSADGRFVFTNLPSGNYVLYRTPHLIMGPTTESHRMILELAAGESKEVEYGFGGRTVIGRIDAGADVDWKNDVHLLSVKLPPPPPNPSYYAYADPKEFEKARRAHGRSKAVLDYEGKRQQFQLVFDREGGFKVDDVPPGKYELNIRVTKPVKNSGRNRFERSEEVMGSLQREITIPAARAGEEFDLGTLEMEVKEGLAVASAPLDLTAEQLDGKPVSLASLRGRPTLLVFWGKWAPGSAAKLEEFRTAVASLEASRRPVLFTINLDSNLEDAHAGVKGLGAGWIHARLTGPSLSEVTERLGVDTLPAVLLLDSEGRLLGRDLDARRLASRVKRLAANKN
jgi:protocatechuate 3,4-dioxygenase beta subunit